MPLATVLGVVENCEQRKVITLTNRIEFMVVALCTFHGQT